MRKPKTMIQIGSCCAILALYHCCQLAFLSFTRTVTLHFGRSRYRRTAIIHPSALHSKAASGYGQNLTVTGQETLPLQVAATWLQQARQERVPTISMLIFKVGP